MQYGIQHTAVQGAGVPTAPQICPQCKGLGYVWNGALENQEACSECLGSGKVHTA